MKDNQYEDYIIGTVISLLDILVIIQSKDNQILKIVLVVLLNTVTKDHLIRILLVLLTIIWSEVSEQKADQIVYYLCDFCHPKLLAQTCPVN